MSLPRRVEAVVFDMDGVLFDTERYYEKSAIAAAAELGFEMSSAFFRSTIGSPWPIVRGQVLAKYGEHVAVDDLGGISRRIFGELIERNDILKPGVREMVALLERLGLPKAIATSSSRPTVERHLAKYGLLGRFHVVAHGEYEKHKPHPEPFLKAAEVLKVAPESCLALEDSHHGVRAASSAGMTTIMVPDLLPCTPEIAGLCLRVVPDLHEVHRLISASR
jgi:HAD superfamily hydrolase (TIGR01509 family)